MPNYSSDEFSLPALTAGIQNQGLNNYVPREGATILKNVISISANGANTGATFFQSKEFTVLQDAYAIEWIDKNNKLNENQFLFFVSAINKAIYGKQYYDSLDIYKGEYIVEKIDGGFRKKVELISFEAYREALANAIVHRTWDINANTKIEMYQDKIIISSPGGLDGDMTKEDYIKGNYSYLRNPIIANVFRRLNIIEAFATGIKRINEAYKNAYVKPTYNVTPSAISITLPVIEDYSLSLNEAKVMDSIKDNYLYSRSDIEKISGFTKDKLIRLLASLQEKGLIEKSGKGRTTYYKKK